MGDYDQCLNRFDEERHRFQLFADSVAQFFLSHPVLSGGVVHSVKVRLKGRSNLEGKLHRKRLSGVTIDATNLFQEVTDLSGVRVFHLHNAQFPLIHREIVKQVDRGDWTLGEKPKVFSWDPEASAFFSDLGFEPEIRSTFYTSIHYLLRPSESSDICCELQVRTLFEEVWGEIDHLLNYPSSTSSVACREQLRALSKLVGTGSRLVDSIVRSSEEFDQFSRLRVSEEPAPSAYATNARAKQAKVGGAESKSTKARPTKPKTARPKSTESRGPRKNASKTARSKPKAIRSRAAKKTATKASGSRLR